MKHQSSPIRLYLSVFVVGLASLAGANACPEDWVFNEMNGKCYKLLEGRVCWTEAKEVCRRIGGELATVRIPKENAWIADHAGHGKNSNALWLGLQPSVDCVFQWGDGSYPRFTDWYGSAPNCWGMDDIYCGALMI
ncbi:chondroitin sulfate proteoglycan 3-like protein [Aphelenchoides avenae]|nr:chondroitin sulfate proteoglycan 3-like protein [Aphelenchus avenae]